MAVRDTVADTHDTVDATPHDLEHRPDHIDDLLDAAEQPKEE